LAELEVSRLRRCEFEEIERSHGSTILVQTV
jgi:hypothetical protein